MTHFQDQFRPKATTAVLGMNVDLLEVCCVALKQLRVRKSDREIVGQHDPQMSRALSLFQDFEARRFVQDGLGRMSAEEPRGSQFNGCQPREILLAGRGDGVARGQLFNPRCGPGTGVPSV